MGVLIGSFMHEANTFSTFKADLDHFKKSFLLFDQEIVDRFQNTNTELGGFLKALGERDIKVIPSMATYPTPSGKVTKETFSYLKGELIRRIKSCKTLDGVLLALHGCMVTEDSQDGEGNILEEIKGIVGNNVYIACSLDFHANVTAKMVRYANVLVGYETAPHVDMFETGKRAGEILISLIEKKFPTCTVMKKIPMLLHGDKMITSQEPLAALLKKVKATREKNRIVSTSIFAGFPLDDIKEVGASVVVSSTCDEELAEKEASFLGREFRDLRENFLLTHLSIEEALDEAMKTPGGPVVFSDPADNPSAGAAGDTTFILKALIERGIRNAALAVIRDPEAVAVAIKTGVGKKVTMEIGGKFDDVNSYPLKVTGVVKLISNGRYIYKGPMKTGLQANMGRTVVLKIEDIDVVLTENQVETFDPEVFRSNGVEPKDRKIVVLKDGLHFRAAYEPIAKAIFYIDSPGFSSVNFSKLPYKNISRPIFPLDKDTQFN